jgi:Fe-S-cluster-containing dehydrogenase component
MKSTSRRSFLKASTAITAAAAGLTPSTANAGPKNVLSPNRMGVLVDTTVCIGCRNCEWACKTAHGIETPPLESYEDQKPLEQMRRPDETALTVVNKFDNPAQPDLPTTVKVQCMHCDHPACVSACIVGAIVKHENGAVVWDTDKCIGCRYCMVACPFQIPAFEYRKALQPRIMKCDFCIERQDQGKLPACVESCPVEALTFGPREELVRVAQDKIRRAPDRYIDHIYGEQEVGGTSWCYLADQSFDQLAMPKLGESPAPGVSESIQHGIFAYFVPPVSLYALLGAVMWTSRQRSADEEDQS